MPERSSLRPTVIDLALDDDALRPACVGVLDSLSPTLALVNHGCEAKLRDLAAAMRRRIGGVGGSAVGDQPVAQQAHDIDGTLAPKAEDVRGCLRNVCMRVLGIALGDGALDATLAARGLEVHGRLCLREYPREREAADADASVPDIAAASHEGEPDGGPVPRLGAHCDNTLLTLLWADGPGLEVLDPSRANDWAPEAVLRYGLPTMGETSEMAELRHDQWAAIDLDWTRDPLLLTVGTAWLSNELVAAACPARCAVLHRVVVPPGRARHSLPFLVDLVPRVTESPPQSA